MTATPMFFAPGPMEMLIIGMICVLPLVVAVVLLVVLRAAKPTSPPPPPCAKCGGWTVPGTKFCPHCGSLLGAAPPPDGDLNEPK